MNRHILDEVNKYYSEKIIKHGATSEGVDWNGKESHFLRFNQLAKVFSTKKDISILDYGCGFGSLIDYLDDCNYLYSYTGYDISEEMIKKGNQIHQKQNVFFTSDLCKLKKVDYVVANGIFNVKLDTSEEDWKRYILETITKMDKLSEKGLSFNILTSYSDKEFKKDYLHYADPLYYFDYCKKNFSKNVALLHDYNLYEFTILIRK